VIANPPGARAPRARSDLKAVRSTSDTEGTMRPTWVPRTHHRATSFLRPLRSALLVGCAAAVLAACTPSAGESGTGGPVGPPTASRPGSGATREPAPQVDTYVTAGERLGIGGCAVFPRDHVFHATVTALPVRERSAATIQSMGPDSRIGAGFGSTVWMGSRPGIPTNVVDSRTAPRQDILVSDLYAETSETEDMPWPAEPRFEGWPGRAWDKHLLVVDSATCSSWEAINMQPPGENVWGTLLNRWYADKVVKLDLGSNAIPPKGTVTASGLSMLSGMVRYDEVAAGRIGHVLMMASPKIRKGPSVWPANGSDGRSTDPDAPPMGTWLRLRSDVDLSHLGPQARVVAEALKVHGAVIFDTGPSYGLMGEPDTRWADGDLAGLQTLTIGMFEVVDPTPMQVSPTSHQIR
jgi:hypothetical protein